MKLRSVLAISITLVVTCGCRPNDTEMALQSLNNQTAQNQAMAALQREVAAGARELTVADANARLQSIELQQQIEAERVQLNAAWSDLHSQQRRDALSLRTESFLSALIRGGGAAAAAVFALAITRSALSMQGAGDDAELTALILQVVSTPSEATSSSHAFAIASPPATTHLAVQHQEL